MILCILIYELYDKNEINKLYNLKEMEAPHQTPSSHCMLTLFPTGGEGKSMPAEQSIIEKEAIQFQL